MDELSGLNWDAEFPDTATTVSSGNGRHYATLQHSPSLSRYPSPLPQRTGDMISTRPQSRPLLNPSGPDSFSKLLASNAAKTPNPLSLQERQKRLLEEKTSQEIEQKKHHNDLFHLDDSSFWEGLGSGRDTPAPGYSTSVISPNQGST